MIDGQDEAVIEIMEVARKKRGRPTETTKKRKHTTYLAVIAAKIRLQAYM